MSQSVVVSVITDGCLPLSLSGGGYWLVVGVVIELWLSGGCRCGYRMVADVVIGWLLMWLSDGCRCGYRMVIGWLLMWLSDCYQMVAAVVIGWLLMWLSDGC